MITIDGSQGEGGGQILRTSLSLALVTGEPFRITNIRAGRKRPGLLRQHLTAVQAAERVGSARVEGATLGSLELTFRPGSLEGGEFQFAVGTAGSTSLVLQTILPALLKARAASELVLEGGTHNPFAPPFDFLEKSFLPQLARTGARVGATLERHGFYPAGGGRVRVRVEPLASLEPFELFERGNVVSRRARALVANLPSHIAERELEVVQRKLDWTADECETVLVRDSTGPGNLLSLECAFEHVTEVVTSFGEKDLPAAAVADRAVQSMRAYLASGAPVGEHLADQLVLLLALAGGGAFVTQSPSAHTVTNVDVVQRFLPVSIEHAEASAGQWRVSVTAR